MSPDDPEGVAHLTDAELDERFVAFYWFSLGLQRAGMALRAGRVEDLELARWLFEKLWEPGKSATVLERVRAERAEAREAVRRLKERS